MELSALLPFLIGGGGLATLLIAALRYQRQDAGEVVTQAKDMMASMRMLIDAQLEENERLRLENEALHERVRYLEGLKERRA